MRTESLKSKMLTKPHGFTSGIEGPSCDKNGNIYAVNFKRPGTIGKVTPNGKSSVFIELPMNSIGCGTRIDSNGTLFIADYVKHNIFAVNIKTKEINVFAHNPAMNQPNDLAITDQGVLFASDPNWRQSTGQIWRINKNGDTHLLETNMGTTNGIEVSPDGKKLYVNETIQRKIWVYDLSSNYELSNKRLFIEFSDFGLDGMRCDMAGNLYVSRIGKGVVAKISPDGHLLSEIHLTGKNCTNLTFGGPDGKTCYVTVSDTGNIQMFRTDVPGRCWSLLHARKHELSPKTVGRWVQDYRNPAQSLKEDQDIKKQLDQALKLIGKLQVENEILKDLLKKRNRVRQSYRSSPNMDST